MSPWRENNPSEEQTVKPPLEDFGQRLRTTSLLRCVSVVIAIAISEPLSAVVLRQSNTECASLRTRVFCK
jgi:hypothetical protein